MNRLVLVSIAAILLAALACASGAAPAAQLPGPTVTAAVPTEFVPTPIPVTPTYEGCAYVWGSEDLPELSRIFNAKLQELTTDLTGLAYAYGENCVYGDGHQTFSAKETDFRVGLKLKTLRDEAALGDWIAKIMPIVLSLPQDQMQGPQAGRVDFDFKQADPGELFVTVPIDRYRSEGQGLRGTELLHLFSSP